jgi:hypothetical protein
VEGRPFAEKRDSLNLATLLNMMLYAERRMWRGKFPSGATSPTAERVQPGLFANCALNWLLVVVALGVPAPAGGLGSR